MKHLVLKTWYPRSGFWRVYFSIHPSTAQVCCEAVFVHTWSLAGRDGVTIIPSQGVGLPHGCLWSPYSNPMGAADYHRSETYCSGEHKEVI